jgi:hypothetical protein
MTRMARPLCLCLTLFVEACSSTPTARFGGRIVASQCVAKLPPMMSTNESECVSECIRTGGKYVLFDSTTASIYKLDDQIKSSAFPGQVVSVTGQLRRFTKTIHVQNILPD